jgi:hypothetical protein
MNDKTIIFVAKSKQKHGDKYDYSLVDYIKNSLKIRIICPKHGVFEQTPNNHLKGCGCKKCNTDNQRFNINQFVNSSKQKHGDKYDYSLVNYVNMTTKIEIICPIHGKFEQLPKKHIIGSGCYECGVETIKNKTRKTNKVFKNDSNNIHNYKYSYFDDYINSHNKIRIVCSEHGEFTQKPYSHLTGKGCPKCGIKYDKSEGEIKKFIKLLGINIIENSRDILNGKELDIFIPSHNIAIEYNGLYWHSEEFVNKNYHLNKTNLCEKKDIKLIHIFEDEWLYKQNIVKSRIKNVLGLTEYKIYSRKCVIREVLSKDSKEFLDGNHTQGNVNSKIKLGLYYDNDLVSIMTFGGLRKSTGGISKEHSYELLRFCNKLDTNVIGGAGKLLKYFIKTYNPKEIISYADRRWSQGDLYEKIGFEFIHNSQPNYFYINGKKREHRFGYRKDILVKKGFDPKLSEHQIMLDRGVHRIYDCGNKKYKYEKR